MKVEYDPAHDVLYVWFARPGTHSATTEVIRPGVYADFDREDNIIGLEVLEASSVLDGTLAFEVALGADR